MIFGFNTDVQHEDIVYHVESEAQPGPRILLSTIFVKGEVFGRRTVVYTEDASAEGLTEQQVHELLKAQHRQVLDAIRAGRAQEIAGETPNSV